VAERARRARWLPAAGFLLPAAVVLGVLVVYPIVATIVFSFTDRTGASVVGLDNYREMLTNPRILTAIRNTAIWVVVVPVVVTTIGLVFAVVTERVSFGRAFKTIVFMPMAISLVAGGVIWRVVYEEDPDRGALNAAARAAVSVVRPPGPYAGAVPSGRAHNERGPTVVYDVGVRPGDAIPIGLVRLSADGIPETARPARTPQRTSGAITGVVFRDFTPGRTGTRGKVDPGELGLPGATVELRGGAGVVGRAVTEDDGRFTIGGIDDRSYDVVLPASNFRPAFGGVQWLGPALVTPAIIAAYTWMWAGFAMVVIAAGLAAISREVLEAARVDGATEWQTFRYVTAPLLAPVLVVVAVTMVIYVLKIFDIVLVIAPSTVQDDANVVALEMWQTAFGARNLGLGSAVAVLLLLLVVPVMALNVRRFRMGDRT
jgi:alpha-glucoside transport system permease protein